MDGDGGQGGLVGDVVDLARFGSVSAGGRLFLLANGNANGVGDESDISIRLDDGGETLTLQTADATVNSWVKYPEVSDACSLARIPDGAGDWALSIPTPDAPNGGGP